MQSMGMGMPFGGMFDHPNQQGFRSGPRSQPQNPFDALMPHGFMNPMSMMMMDPFQAMQQSMSMAGNGSGNGFSYCSSSVTSYSTDEHGRPQVYQQSNEVKSGPNGLKETKSAVRDSRSGRQELAIGHHLHDKAHVKKKSKNVYTGEEEQVDDLVNLEEEELDNFEQNWMQQARNVTTHNQLRYDPYGRPPQNNRLALTSAPDEHVPRASSSHEKPPKKEKKKKKSKSDKYI